MSVVLFVLPFYVDRTQKIVPGMGVVLKRIIRSRAMVKKKDRNGEISDDLITKKVKFLQGCALWISVVFSRSDNRVHKEGLIKKTSWGDTKKKHDIMADVQSNYFSSLPIFFIQQSAPCRRISLMFPFSSLSFERPLKLPSLFQCCWLS